MNQQYELQAEPYIRRRSRPDTAIRIKKSTLEQVFVVVALLLLTGAFKVLFVGRGSEFDPEAGSSMQQVVFFIIYLVALYWAIPHWKKLLAVARRGVLLWALVALVMFSVLWSEAPQVTLRRSIALILTSFFGIYFSARYSLEQQLKLLAWALGIAVVFSLLFSLLPGYGITPSGRNAGAWRGVYLQKNYLGRMMLLSMWVFWLISSSRSRYLWLKRVLFAMSVGLLLLSRSLSAWLILVGMLALYQLYKALRWEYALTGALYTAALLAVSAVAWWLVPRVEAILEALGRDTTLTGRAHLWSGMLEVMRRRPWLGYGYGGFWLGWDGPSGEVWKSMPTTFYPLHGHNGFLDLGADLGVVGIVTFGLGFLCVLLWSINWLYTHRTAIGLWPILFLTFMFVYNVSESVIVKRNNIFWVVYVAIFLSLAVERNRVRRQRRKLRPQPPG